MSRDRDRQDLNPTGTPAAFGDPPLTSRPEGLLDLLGIQSGGRYPQTLSPVLAPTFELGPWYSEYNQTFRTSNFDPNALGVGLYFDTGLQVPDGELWIVNRVAIALSIIMAAPQNEQAFQIVRTNNANTSVVPVCHPVKVSTNNPATRYHAILGNEFASPLIMRPTTKLRLYNNGPAAGAISTGTSTAVVAVKIVRI